MKIKNLLSIALLTCSLSVMGQAKKPTLMVVPSDAWCKEHKYEQAFCFHRQTVECGDSKN